LAAICARATRAAGLSVSAAPCLNMAAVFRDHNITHIDFFSLDVEGSEASVIKR
jgi:hypothetical protein